ARRTGHTPRATRDLQARLHELRRVGRRFWHLDTTATASRHRDQRGLLGPGPSGPDRLLAAVSLLPPAAAAGHCGGPPAGSPNSVEVRHGQRHADLIVLAAARRQRGTVVPPLGPPHRAGPP